MRPPIGNSDHAEGPADAPVRLVEYGDYECSHRRHVAPIIQQLQERFEL